MNATIVLSIVLLTSTSCKTIQNDSVSKSGDLDFNKCKENQKLVKNQKQYFKKNCLELNTRNNKQCKETRETWKKHRAAARKHCSNIDRKDLYLEASGNPDIQKMIDRAAKFTPHTNLYIPDSHDCDDFASEFAGQCTVTKDKVYIIFYSCGSGGHAINALQENGTLCFVEPQAKAVIKGTCVEWDKKKAPKASQLPPSVGFRLCTLLDRSYNGSREISRLGFYDKSKQDSTDKIPKYCADYEYSKYFNRGNRTSCDSCCDKESRTHLHILPTRDPVDPESNIWLRQCNRACKVYYP